MEENSSRNNGQGLSRTIHLRLEQNMKEVYQLEQITAVLKQQRNDECILNVQLFSYFACIPFVLSNNVTSALISIIQERQYSVSLQFDFCFENSNLERLLSLKHLSSIQLIGAPNPTTLRMIESSTNLKHLQITIRASESNLDRLSHALKHNTSLLSLNLCSYNESYPQSKLLNSALLNHPTLKQLELRIAYQHTLKLLFDDIAMLPHSLEELQVSSIVPIRDIGWICSLLHKITIHNPNLRRLSLSNMNLNTEMVDEILCHIPRHLKFLDLYGNPNIDTIYFSKFHENQLRETSPCLELREFNLHPQINFDYILDDQNGNNLEAKALLWRYFQLLFSKNPNLYQFGGNVERLFETNVEYHPLLFLVDWNRSGARRLMPNLNNIPYGLWPIILERIGGGNVNQGMLGRQASVLSLIFQESSSQILQY